MLLGRVNALLSLLLSVCMHLSVPLCPSLLISCSLLVKSRDIVKSSDVWYFVCEGMWPIDVSIAVVKHHSSLFFQTGYEIHWEKTEPSPVSFQQAFPLQRYPFTSSNHSLCVQCVCQDHNCLYLFQVCFDWHTWTNRGVHMVSFWHHHHWITGMEIFMWCNILFTNTNWTANCLSSLWCKLLLN